MFTVTGGTLVRTKKSKKKGTARMRELGQVSVNVWLDPSEAEQLDRVRGNFPRATWARHMILNAIRQVLQTQNDR